MFVLTPVCTVHSAAPTRSAASELSGVSGQHSLTVAPEPLGAPSLRGTGQREGKAKSICPTLGAG